MGGVLPSTLYPKNRKEVFDIFDKRLPVFCFLREPHSRFKTAMRTLAKGKDLSITYKNDVVDVVIKLAGIITKPGVMQMVRRGLNKNSSKGKK